MNPGTVEHLVGQPSTDHVASQVAVTRRGKVPTFFIRECPACGRPIQIKVEYWGRRLYCQHCGCRFLAMDRPDSHSP